MKQIKDISRLQNCELWENSSLKQLHSRNILTVKVLHDTEKRMSKETSLTKPESQLLTGVRETIKAYRK